MIELADTTAWTKHHRVRALATDFDARLARGEIATCPIVVLELLRTALDAVAFAELRADLARLRNLAIRRREWDRAADVMQTLAERGPLHHRQVTIPDLLIAAAAESAEVPVLHYDRDFELIAEVTGQPMRALAPLGSL